LAKVTIELELVTVTIAAALVRFTPVVGKTSRVGLIVTNPSVPPVPLNPTVAEDKAELMVNAPVKSPLTAGVKTNPTWQLAPAAKVLAQVFCEMLKGGLGVAEKDRAVAVALPELVIITICAALVWPIVGSVKVNCDGLTLIPLVAVPVPFSGTETAATPSVEEETTSEAEFAPAEDGVKVTGTVQLPLALNVVPQVLVPVEKLLACAPVIWKPTLDIAAPPALLTASVKDELATPTS
jgi:hypothetical protein